MINAENQQKCGLFIAQALTFDFTLMAAVEGLSLSLLLLILPQDSEKQTQVSVCIWRE